MCGDNIVFNAKGKVNVIQLLKRKYGPLCSFFLFRYAFASLCYSYPILTPPKNYLTAKCGSKKLATYRGGQGPIVIPVKEAGMTFFTSGTAYTAVGLKISQERSRTKHKS
jgi:hypothetical protein